MKKNNLYDKISKAKVHTKAVWQCVRRLNRLDNAIDNNKVSLFLSLSLSFFFFIYRSLISLCSFSGTKTHTATGKKEHTHSLEFVIDAFCKSNLNHNFTLYSIPNVFYIGLLTVFCSFSFSVNTFLLFSWLLAVHCSFYSFFFCALFHYCTKLHCKIVQFSRQV